MNERTIRPECLRPAHDFWVHPEPDEVREVLRLAELSGSKAAKLLGLGSGDTGSRTIRRYTGGEQKIPYAYWAILCEVAGLGRIWRDPGTAEDGQADKASIDASSARARPNFQAFDEAEEIIRATWAGEREASVANIAACRDALVRMRQVVHAASVSAIETDVVRDLQQRIADTQDKLKVIMSWADVG